jgi:hypothetical protein
MFALATANPIRVRTISSAKNGEPQPNRHKFILQARKYAYFCDVLKWNTYCVMRLQEPKKFPHPQTKF